jgi:limonene 1,2-monooxygenase
VGTPDDAVAKIEELQERSGGFGALLVLANEWANSEKTAKSYELLMRYVAPKFQGQLERVEAGRDWVEDRRLDIFGATPQVMAKAFADHGKELPEPMKRMLEAAAAAREAEATPQPSGD